MELQAKDILTLSVSAVSLIVAITSFILTFMQRKREDKRSIRTSLTDTMASLGEVNLELAKLKIEYPQISDNIVNLRRNYNAQRRYLANHAEFLLLQIPDLATDIDHQLLAIAFDSMGDYVRARDHWEKSIETSPAESLRAMNLRGLARFLFYQGNPQLGRQKYDASLQANLPDNDSNRRFRADSYLMWSITERDFGFVEEARRRREQALAEANRIGHQGMREEIVRYIDDLWLGRQHDAASPPTYPPSVELAPLPSKSSGE